MSTLVQYALAQARSDKPTRLLVINPNTGSASTARLVQFVPQALPPGASAQFVTARFGAPYIACEASYAVASHAMLDAWAEALRQSIDAEQPHRVLIGCFGDPGLFALRESAACAVTGLAEASFIEAAAHGDFAIVTGGARWKPMLERLALSLDFAKHLQHIETVSQSGAELLADPELAQRVLVAACECAAKSGARAIIVGGVGLAGHAAQLQSFVSVPLIDSVLAGVRGAMSDTLPEPQRAENRFNSTWTGVSDAMIRLGA